MKTYQDFEKVKDADVGEWLVNAITDYKSSEFYATASIADEYARQKNTTIMRYQKLLYTMSGKAVPDNFSANHKCASNFFNRFVTQEASYLLGNGASFAKNETKDKLGKDFDKKLYFAGKNALIHGVSYGFFNFDHLQVFTALEFAPLYDEENGMIRAGIRFWQIDSNKPMRFTFYEEDGYTEYVLKDGNVSEFKEKQDYIQVVATSEADGEEIVDGRNYPSFPIVPLWGNPYHQSEIVGIRSGIDSYDLIKSGFANDLDDASQIYWIIQNAGGMDDVDLAKFLQKIKTVHAAVVDEDGATAESHTIEVPYESRETYLNRIEKDLYKDYMALDIENMASGAMTATQIKAAYEKVNEKTDEFEFNVVDFVQEILLLNGIEDEVTFTRSMIVNQQEMITTILAAASMLPDEYVTKKLLEVFGDIDKVEEILAMKIEGESDLYPKKKEESVAEKEEEVVEEETEENVNE